MQQPEPHRALTYASYLKLDELLSLRAPRSDGPEHDETLFIIIHQVYELWFKQILHEVDHVQRAFESNDRPAALATLGRIRNILKVLVSQIDVLETMTPVAFGSFRSRLDAASGFQSAQFRELEVVLGRRTPAILAHMPTSETRARVERRMASRSLYESFLVFLAANGYGVPRAILERDPSQPLDADVDVQRILIDIYRKDSDLTQVCERLVDVDEGLQEWRYRHVKMVERTIGAKIGTGGSSGAEYLRSTLFRPHFPDLWAIRSEL